MLEFDPSCFGFSDIVPGFDPSCFGFSGIVPGFDPSYLVVFGTHPATTLSPILVRIFTSFLALARILFFSGTRLDLTLFQDLPRFYLFDTHPDLTHFLVLARIRSPVLRILRYSPGNDYSF